MDPRSIVLLEFPLVRERLVAAASFAPSRRLAEALEPSAELVVVARTVSRTTTRMPLVPARATVSSDGSALNVALSCGVTVNGGTASVPKDRTRRS